MSRLINKKSVIVLVVIALAVATIFIYLYLGTTVFKNKSYQFAQTQADKFLEQHKDDKAIAAYRLVVDHNKSITERYDAALQIAVIYINEQKYDNAIYWYKEAEKIANKEQFGDVQGVALAAELKGDKSTAVTYYKKALDLYPSNSPIVSMEKAQLKQKIIELGGQP